MPTFQDAVEAPVCGTTTVQWVVAEDGPATTARTFCSRLGFVLVDPRCFSPCAKSGIGKGEGSRQPKRQNARRPQRGTKESGALPPATVRATERSATTKERSGAVCSGRGRPNAPTPRGEPAVFASGGPCGPPWSDRRERNRGPEPAKRGRNEKTPTRVFGPRSD